MSPFAVLLLVITCLNFVAIKYRHNYSPIAMYNPQTRTHAENLAEAAARATTPASVSKMIGVGGELAGQTAKDLDRAINLLKGYLTEDRLARMQDVLDQRTGSATIVFENPANPNNVSLSPLSPTLHVSYHTKCRTVGLYTTLPWSMWRFTSHVGYGRCANLLLCNCSR